METLGRNGKRCLIKGGNSLNNLEYKSKPSISTPENLLKLVKDLSWLDTSKLMDFKGVVKDILDENPLIDKERSQIISELVNRRIEIVINRKKELSK